MLITPQNAGSWLIGQPVNVGVAPGVKRQPGAGPGLHSGTVDEVRYRQEGVEQAPAIVPIVVLHVAGVGYIDPNECVVEFIAPPGESRDEALARRIGEALGAVSVCWERISLAGVFDSSTAADITRHLVADVFAHFDRPFPGAHAPNIGGIAIADAAIITDTEGTEHVGRMPGDRSPATVSPPAYEQPYRNPDPLPGVRNLADELRGAHYPGSPPQFEGTERLTAEALQQGLADRPAPAWATPGGDPEQAGRGA